MCFLVQKLPEGDDKEFRLWIRFRSPIDTKVDPRRSLAVVIIDERCFRKNSAANPSPALCRSFAVCF